MDKVSRPFYRRLTAEEREGIVQLRQQGKTLREVAETFGVSIGTVYKHSKRAGIKGRQGTGRPTEYARIPLDLVYEIYMDLNARTPTGRILKGQLGHHIPDRFFEQKQIEKLRRERERELGAWREDEKAGSR